MRGHLQQRSRDTWVYVGRSADGRKRYIERTVRGTRREAERDLARLVVEVDEGRHLAAAPMTYGELLDRWLEVKRGLVEPTTVGSYEWLARTYIRPVLGDRKLASIRPIDLDGLYAALRRRGLSTRTIRLCHTVNRQALEQARKWGLVARSPAVDATPPGQRRREVTPPTVDEVRALLGAAADEDPDCGTYLWGARCDRCRRAEACALRWSDIDLDHGEVTIGRAIAMAGGVPYEKDTKTTRAGASLSTKRPWAFCGTTGAVAAGAGLQLGAAVGEPSQRPARPPPPTSAAARM